MAISTGRLPWCSPTLLFGASAAILLAMFSIGNAGAERLPGTVAPRRYALALTPDLSKATFEGSETIDVTLAEPAEAITLNAVDIAFKTVTVTAAEKQQTARISLDKNNEEATFTFAEKITAGKARLQIEYSGTLNDKLRGFICRRRIGAIMPSRSSNRPMRGARFRASTSRR